MEIDIREGYDGSEVDEIRFGSSRWDTISVPDEQISEFYFGSSYYGFEQIDNIIKALQKAKELWVDERD